ncbi:GNAT family N-acetyltransferase [Actinokineospora sp. 24-640]
MTMAGRVHDPRTDEEPVGWAEFRAAAALHPVWDFDLMRVEAWSARAPVVLAVARDGARIAAAASVQLWRPPTRGFAAIPGARSVRLRPVLAQVVLPWLSGYPGYAFHPDLTAAGRREAVRGLERALARGPGVLAGLVYRAVDPADLPTLSGPGRVARSIMPTMVLDNRWSTMDGWLACLNRSRRKAMRRVEETTRADPGLDVRESPGRDDVDGHEVAALINRHRAGFPPQFLELRTPVSGAYLDRFLRRPDVRCLTYRRRDDGRLIAVNTVVDHPRSPVLQHWAALRDAEGGRRDLYFDCYRRGVRHMIDAGRAEISAGRGMTELKATLGFTPRDIVSLLVPGPLAGVLP